jgi:hypothetical protein
MIFHLKGQFSLQEETENQHLYTEAEEWLRQNVAKHHEKWDNEDCFLHHDNSLAYSSSFGQEFLSTNCMTVVFHTHTPQIWSHVTVSKIHISIQWK